MPPLVTVPSGGEHAPLRTINPRSSSLQLRLPSRPASPDAAAAQIRLLQTKLAGYAITPSPVEDRQGWLAEGALARGHDGATTTPSHGPGLSPRTRTSSIAPVESEPDGSPIRAPFARRQSMLPQLGLDLDTFGLQTAAEQSLQPVTVSTRPATDRRRAMSYFSTLAPGRTTSLVDHDFATGAHSSRSPTPNSEQAPTLPMSNLPPPLSPLRTPNGTVVSTPAERALVDLQGPLSAPPRAFNFTFPMRPTTRPMAMGQSTVVADDETPWASTAPSPVPTLPSGLPYDDEVEEPDTNPLYTALSSSRDTVVRRAWQRAQLVLIPPRNALPPSLLDESERWSGLVALHAFSVDDGATSYRSDDGPDGAVEYMAVLDQRRAEVTITSQPQETILLPPTRRPSMARIASDVPFPRSHDEPSDRSPMPSPSLVETRTLGILGETTFYREDDDALARVRMLTVDGAVVDWRAVSSASASAATSPSVDPHIAATSPAASVRSLAADLAFFVCPPPQLAFSTAGEGLFDALGQIVTLVRAFEGEFGYTRGFERSTNKRIRHTIIDVVWRKHLCQYAPDEPRLFRILENVVMGLLHRRIYADALVSLHAVEDARLDSILSIYRQRALTLGDFGIAHVGTGVDVQALAATFATAVDCSPLDAYDQLDVDERTRQRLLDAGLRPSELDALARATTPLDSIARAREAINGIISAVGHDGDEPLATDDLIPLLAFVIVRSDAAKLESWLFWLQTFVQGELGPEFDWTLATVQAAVTYLRIDPFAALPEMPTTHRLRGSKSVSEGARSPDHMPPPLHSRSHLSPADRSSNARSSVSSNSTMNSPPSAFVALTSTLARSGSSASTSSSRSTALNRSYGSTGRRGGRTNSFSKRLSIDSWSALFGGGASASAAHVPLERTTSLSSEVDRGSSGGESESWLGWSRRRLSSVASSSSLFSVDMLSRRGSDTSSPLPSDDATTTFGRQRRHSISAVDVVTRRSLASKPSHLSASTSARPHSMLSLASVDDGEGKGEGEGADEHVGPTRLQQPPRPSYRRAHRHSGRLRRDLLASSTTSPLPPRLDKAIAMPRRDGLPSPISESTPAP